MKSDVVFLIRKQITMVLLAAASQIYNAACFFHRACLAEMAQTSDLVSSCYRRHSCHGLIILSGTVGESFSVVHRALLFVTWNVVTDEEDPVGRPNAYRVRSFVLT